MRTLHQTLHLQHHKHTGKVLHHRHTSYRGLAVVLMLAGLMIIGLNVMARVTADSLFVYARIPAPVPTTAPVITNPTDGSAVNKSSLIVTGTCPDITPHVIIVITDDGVEAGSVACDGNNNFSLPITVTLGQHTLIAKSYTITDDAGPDSAPVTFTYISPAPIPSGSSQSLGGQAGGGSPLVLTIDEPFIIFGPAKDAIWLGTITGGTTPYKVQIDWGDGSTDTYTVKAGGQQHFAHHYRVMQPHDIAFRVTDASGRGILRHYAAVTPYVAPIPITLNSTSPGPLGGPGALGLYGAYLLALAAFGYLWVKAHPFAYAKVPIQRHQPPRAAKRRRRTTGGR